MKTGITISRLLLCSYEKSKAIINQGDLAMAVSLVYYNELIGDEKDGFF